MTTKTILSLLAIVILTSCGKSEADIKAEKEASEKRVSDSLAVVQRVNDSLKHVADLEFVNGIQAQLDSIK